jgi:hypothetical protein
LYAFVIESPFICLVLCLVLSVFSVFVVLSLYGREEAKRAVMGMRDQSAEDEEDLFSFFFFLF